MQIKKPKWKRIDPVDSDPQSWIEHRKTKSAAGLGYNFFCEKVETLLNRGRLE